MQTLVPVEPPRLSTPDPYLHTIPYTKMYTEKKALSRRNLQKIFDKVVELDSGLELRMREAITEAITRVIGQAPEALDTLEELARALDNDDSAAAGVIQKITALRTELSLTRATVDTLANAEPYTSDDIDAIVADILAEETTEADDNSD